MTSTGLFGRRDQVLADSTTSMWIAGGLVIGAITFNAFLCLINSHGITVSNHSVIISEIIIICLTFLKLYRSINAFYFFLITIMVLYTLLLSALRYDSAAGEVLNVKISRDLLIPIAFILLGKSVNDVKAADKIVFVATGLIFSFAIFEYFFLESFLQVFQIAQYYIARGTLKASEWALDVSNGLMVSGFRPEDQGRALLPFLGRHRVSSLFLEPSTLGNFGALVTLWAVVRSRMERQIYFWTAAGGLALLILSDARFSAYFLALAVLMMLTPPKITTPCVFLMPFVAILGLYFFGVSADQHGGIPFVEGLGIEDRLLYSGRVLFDFDIYNWFGGAASSAQTFDAGYGYVISNAGIIGFIVFWVLLMSLKGHNRHFYPFRNVTGAYFATLLCISASLFTIKIAALLWFLLGALSTARDKDSPLLLDRVRNQGRFAARY